MIPFLRSTGRTLFAVKKADTTALLKHMSRAHRVHLMLCVYVRERLVHSLIHSLSDSFIHSLIHSLSHTHSHSLTHSLTLSLTYSLTLSHTHTFTHSHTHTLSHSFPQRLNLTRNGWRTTSRGMREVIAHGSSNDDT